MSDALIIYHAGCPDGFCAAWVASRALGSEHLHEGRYGEAPPLEAAQGRDVYVLDFSYPRAQLEQLAAVAKSLTVLDHHQTAEAELRGMPGCTFDMHRSGAGLTWRHFHRSELPPWIVSYVEDRDLWRFRLPHSRAIATLIRATPHRLEEWDKLARRNAADALIEASGAQAYLDCYVRAALKGVRKTRIDEWNGLVVNVIHEAASDVLNAALERDPEAQVALGWFVGSDGNVYVSMRSRDGVDCSPFAAAHGGGGHAQACGFRIWTDVGESIEAFRSSEWITSRAFARAYSNAYQDDCENCWLSSVGGDRDESTWSAPIYVAKKDRERYLAGYRHYAKGPGKTGIPLELRVMGPTSDPVAVAEAAL